MADEMRPEWLLAARPEIERLGQLKGKRIATDPPGENTAALVDLSLERAGLEKDDVQLSTIGESTQRAAALASGRIDATPLEFADFERLRGEGGLDLNVLSTLQDLSPVKPRTAFLVRRDFAAKHRPLLQELVNGLVDGYAFLYTPAGRGAWIEKARKIGAQGRPRGACPGRVQLLPGPGLLAPWQAEHQGGLRPLGRLLARERADREDRSVRRGLGPLVVAPGRRALVRH